MQIKNINSLSSPKTYYKNSNNTHSNKNVSRQYITTQDNVKTPFYKDINIVKRPQSISFMGKTVHIVDGGNHATNMQHFAKAISNSMDIKMHDVLVNAKNSTTKQLRSLEEQLKYLNNKKSLLGEFVAVPALASVPILNIQDQYNRIMGEDKKFTPENLKVNKKNLLTFLKSIYDNPALYREYINYMDPSRQGIEYTYGVIQEINKLKEKGAKVYIPSGHPQDDTLKWMAKERGLNPELYHYIATGDDINNSVHKMIKEIRDNNWYSFNLLALSDANIVGVKDAKGNNQDYLFAAYDSCITDGARGVYNFSPIRENGKLIGYSYTDTTTNEYPYDEFPANDEIANLTKFVGKPFNSVVASDDETAELKDIIKNGGNKANCADKLYLVSDLFTQKEITSKKMNLNGIYVDKTLNTFFDINKSGKIIFPKSDCEGSGKPSVLSMWGSCFAVFNAIARDIEIIEKSEDTWKVAEVARKNNDIVKTYFNRNLSPLYQKLEFAKRDNNYKEMENVANNIINSMQIMQADFPELNSSNTTKGTPIDLEKKYIKVYSDLIYSLCKQNKDNEAKTVINSFINMVSGFNKEGLKEYKDLDLHKIVETAEKKKAINKKRIIEHEKRRDFWKNASKFTKFFMNEPVLILKREFPDEKIEKYIKNLNCLSDLFKQIGDICKKQGENYPAAVCYSASEDFAKFNNRAFDVLQRRIDKVEFIGDLYPEIKKG